MRVVLNFAISADGKIGTHTGGASKFTSHADLQRLWQIRLQADAILVGRGTLEADNMSMTIPEHCAPPRQPLRLVASRRGQFNPTHPVFQTAGGPIHLLCTDARIENAPAGVRCHHSSLSTFIDTCRQELGIQTLLCEGGGELVRSLVELGLVTDIHLTMAGHTLIGGATAPGILGRISAHLQASQRFRLTHFEPLDNGECFLSYQREDA